MGDFPAPPLQSVKLSDLIHRAVDKSYEDLHSLTRDLQKETDEERRSLFLKYLNDARQRFIHLLVLVKWSVQSSLYDQCEQLLNNSRLFTNQLNETNDRMFFMHADLNRAKESIYDVSSAVDVLFGGKYLRLPTVIENSMMPRELSPVNLEETTRILDDLLRFRLLETLIPSEITNIEVDQGFVVCEVEGQFEFVITLQGSDANSKWKVHSIRTALSYLASGKSNNSEREDTASTTALRAIAASAPDESHYSHLKNILQKVLVSSEQPLVDACNVIRDFCACLSLEVLSAQALLLTEERWKNQISVQYHREKNTLDFCYWKGCQLNTTPLDNSNDTKKISPDSHAIPYPKDSMCLRMTISPSGKSLLSLMVYPPVPAAVANSSLAKSMQIPKNLQHLSAERLLLSAIRVHAASLLHSLQHRLTLGALEAERSFSSEKDDSVKEFRTTLVTGEPLIVMISDYCVRMKRADIEGLSYSLQFSVDLRSGKFVVSSEAESSGSLVNEAIREVHRLSSLSRTRASLRNTNTKVSQIDGPLQVAVAVALREVAAEEVGHIGRSCLGVDPEHCVPLNWDKFIEYRKLHGGEVDDLSISKGSLFFRLANNNECTYYLVVELDKQADIVMSRDSLESITVDEDDWVTVPSFAVLQTSRRSSLLTSSGVQFFQRLPAIRRSDINMSNDKYPSFSSVDDGIDSLEGPRKKLCNAMTSRTKEKKDSVQNQSNNRNHSNRLLRALLLHAVATCSERVQLQQFCNDARGLKMKVRYFGEGGTTQGHGTGGQVIHFSLPDDYRVEPLEISDLYAHLCPGGGFEICLKPSEPPFEYVQSASSKSVLADVFDNHLLSMHHNVMPCGKMIFRYPAGSGFWYGRPGMEMALKIFVQDLLLSVSPMVSFARVLHKFLKPLGRYGTPLKPDGHFYVEHADAFEIVLACLCKNTRKTIATGSTPDGNVVHRIIVRRQKQHFLLSCGKGTSHPLLNYIQATLNMHKNPGQLLEALERTTIPLSMLSSVVESKLLSTKYHRSEDGSGGGKTAVGGGKIGDKKGGKGMKLGYKGKFGGKGMRLGYTSDKGLGMDDKLFTPSELVLIPRSQNRIKLAYSNRCSVDIWFKENQTVQVKSAPGGVPVPSCSSEAGQQIAHTNFAEKIRAICTEMGSL